jgi:hypothetical protein
MSRFWSAGWPGQILSQCTIGGRIWPGQRISFAPTTLATILWAALAQPDALTAIHLRWTARIDRPLNKTDARHDSHRTLNHSVPFFPEREVAASKRAVAMSRALTATGSAVATAVMQPHRRRRACRFHGRA